MFYDTAINDHGLLRNPFKAIVAPRPIARCGYADYSVVSTVFSIARPRLQAPAQAAAE